jgi:hypothetical protein
LSFEYLEERKNQYTHTLTKTGIVLYKLNLDESDGCIRGWGGYSKQTEHNKNKIIALKA